MKRTAMTPRRIIIAAEGSAGDVLPMIVLGDWLTRAGHDVTLCAPPDLEPLALKHNVKFVVTGASVRDFLTRSVNAVVKGGGREFFRAAREYALTAMEAHQATLPGLVRGADLVLATGVQIVAKLVAEAERVPYRFITYCPQLLYSLEHPPVTFPWQRAPRFVNAGLWRINRALQARLFEESSNAIRRRMGLPHEAFGNEPTLGDYTLLAADFGLTRVPRDVTRRVVQVGAFQTEPSALPDKVNRFLENGAPPFYLGFGSMAAHDGDVVVEAVRRVCRSLQKRAIVLGGWANLKTADDDQIMLVDSISHGALFPRVSVAVHHGGAGTTTAAARAGVPQIIAPHLLDQYYWANVLARHGVAPKPLDRKKWDVAALEGSLRLVLNDSGYRTRAVALAARIETERLSVEQIVTTVAEI